MDLSPPIRQQFCDNNGNPIVGGKVYTYLAGTTTPKATYLDRAGTPNANPIILDSGGWCDIWLSTGYYKIVLNDANDVNIWTKDYISLPQVGTNGVPSGGMTGQVLSKNSNSDYDTIWKSLQYIDETLFTIANNISAPADITGLLFDKTVVGSAIITYWIKRYTTGAGATNLTEAGTMIATWDLATSTWKLIPGPAGPDYAGVDFTITSAGQVKYVSSNITGTANTSKMKFKATSMGV